MIITILTTLKNKQELGPQSHIFREGGKNLLPEPWASAEIQGTGEIGQSTNMPKVHQEA